MAPLPAALVYKTDQGIVSLGIGYAFAELSSCIVLGIRLHYIMQQYREEYNVQAPKSGCLQEIELTLQGEWGFIDRGRQQRTNNRIAASNQQVVQSRGGYELV